MKRKLLLRNFNGRRKRAISSLARNIRAEKSELLRLDKMANRMQKTIKVKRDEVERICLNKEYTLTQRRMLLKQAEKEERDLYERYIVRWKEIAETRD
ncbi:MAG: hypothetical protein LBR95_00460 [Azoarcus sp.]|jgi:hypothetical protein|nr:hypothetical protein [Azoarcus sp.]